MKKIFSMALIGAVLFSGCTYTQVKSGYSDMKVVYKDVRYVVHEVKNAKKNDAPMVSKTTDLK